MTASTSTVAHPGKLVGLFPDRASAERAFCAAVQLGYVPSDIDVLMAENRDLQSSADLARHPLDERMREEAESAETAAKVGGPLGATAATIAPALAAVGTVTLIPGLLAAGPIAVALVAAGAVGVASGIVGGLTKWGIPEQRASEYAEELRAGAILLGLKPKNDADASALEREWQGAGGRFVHG